MKYTALLLAAFSGTCLAHTTTVSSPDGQIKVTISDEQHTLAMKSALRESKLLHTLL